MRMIYIEEPYLTVRASLRRRRPMGYADPYDRETGERRSGSVRSRPC